MGAANKDWQSAEEETLGVGEDVEVWGSDPHCKRVSSLERSLGRGAEV